MNIKLFVIIRKIPIEVLGFFKATNTDEALEKFRKGLKDQNMKVKVLEVKRIEQLMALAPEKFRLTEFKEVS